MPQCVIKLRMLARCQRHFAYFGLVLGVVFSVTATAQIQSAEVADFVVWVDGLSAGIDKELQAIETELATKQETSGKPLEAFDQGKLEGAREAALVFYSNPYIVKRLKTYALHTEGAAQNELRRLLDKFSPSAPVKPADTYVAWLDTLDMQKPLTETQLFLERFNALYQPLGALEFTAVWTKEINTTDQKIRGRIDGINSVYIHYYGDPQNSLKAQRLLKSVAPKDATTRRQLEKIVRLVADNLTAQQEITDGIGNQLRAYTDALRNFVYGLPYEQTQQILDATTKKLGREPKPQELQSAVAAAINVSNFDKSLSPKERLPYWEASKEVGTAAKPMLEELRGLRNKMANAVGYPSFFALRAGIYSMPSDEMIPLLNRLVAESKPLYTQLHCYARRTLAARYGLSTPPKRLPAHWLANPWAQDWPGLVDGLDLDKLFAEKDADWIMRSAEEFYVGLGFNALPDSFWKESDYLPLPPDATRKKSSETNTRTLDLGQEVRLLATITAPKNGWRSFWSLYHELGHAYYFWTVDDPTVPFILRADAMAPLHEAIGELIYLGVAQIPYLEKLELPVEELKKKHTLFLLNDALTSAPVQLPFYAGVMPSFEHDLYEDPTMTPDKFNERWWNYAAKFQGIEPPTVRSKEGCDGCTKPHLYNSGPGIYYRYALSAVLRFQLHAHICRNIIGSQDLQQCDYDNEDAEKRKKIGDFLKTLMRRSSTEDWRQVTAEMTGKPLGSADMLEYYRPVMQYLQAENGKYIQEHPEFSCSFE